MAMSYHICIQMCCEQDECKLAVFNEVEAVCYLKKDGAENPANSVAAEGVSTYTIDSRSGESVLLVYIATYCDVGHSGGRPRHILPPLSHPQLLIADGNICFSQPIHGRAFLFFFLFSCFALEPVLLLCTDSTKAQAPTATVSTYEPQGFNLIKPSGVTCNRSCTKQQSIYSSAFASTRVRQRKQAGKKSKSVADSHYASYEYIISPLFYCC